jgi:hypothetical protein
MASANELQPAPKMPIATRPEPTAEGAIEYSPAFKSAAQAAFVKTNNGKSNVEAGFTLNRNGQPSAISTQAQDSVVTRNGVPTSGHLDQSYSPDTTAMLHTHNNLGQAQPSGADIEAAKTAKRPVMVESRDGLYEVAADGTISHVFNTQDWNTPTQAKKYIPPPGYPVNWTREMVEQDKQKNKSSVTADVADMVSNHVGNN